MLRMIVNKRWLNRTVCGVIFNVRIGKDFGLKNSVFYIRTVLTENNKFLCIFSFTEILETVVRQSGVLAHRKKCLFCKVTPVSIQAFVEGLLRLANVLEATNGTLKNVNNGRDVKA
jgi:hypothetical protein